MLVAVVDPAVERAKEGAWQEVAAIDAAHEDGRLDDAGWHAAMHALAVPAYLAGDNPRAQSGNSRDAAGWEVARRLLLDLVPADASFLDVGCANGHLMESLVDWAAQRGQRLEPYGLDISAELAALARQRLPRWTGRIWVGNALIWDPPHRFDVVRSGMDYVPPRSRPRLVERLLREVVAPGGRLIIGVYNEERDQRTIEDSLTSWGFTVGGRTERAHPHPALAYRAVWLPGPKRN